MDRQTGRISNAAVQVPYRNLMVAVDDSGVKVVQLAASVDHAFVKDVPSRMPLLWPPEHWDYRYEQPYQTVLFLQDKGFL